MCKPTVLPDWTRFPSQSGNPGSTAQWCVSRLFLRHVQYDPSPSPVSPHSRACRDTGKPVFKKYIVNLMNKSLDLWYTPTPCHPASSDQCSACFYFHGCFKSHHVHIGAETGGPLCRVKWPSQFLGHHASTHFIFYEFRFLSVEEWLTKSDPKVDILLMCKNTPPIVLQTFAVFAIVTWVMWHIWKLACFLSGHPSLIYHPCFFILWVLINVHRYENLQHYGGISFTTIPSVAVIIPDYIRQKMACKAPLIITYCYSIFYS